MTEAETILSMEDVVKTFPGVVALDGVSLSVKRGEIHALIGANGAGKSTLIKILSGVYSRDSGSVALNGKRLGRYSAQDILREGIAFIYQETNLVPFFSVAQNMAVGQEPIRRGLGAVGVVDWKTLVDRCQSVLTRLEVTFSPRDPVSSLTPAQRKVVEIARALLYAPKMLVLDEPTAPLDSKNVEVLFRVVRLLRQQGVSMIYISHRMEEIFDIADRVTVLRDGKNAGTRECASTTPQELISLMVGGKIEDAARVRPEGVGEEVARLEGVSTDRLKDVSLSVRAGEVLGLAGSVGAGKTEVVSVLFGLDAPTSGKVRLFGREARRMEPTRAVRSGLAFIPEDRRGKGLLLDMTVSENMSLAYLDRVSRGGLISSSAERGLAREMVSRLNVKTPSIHQPVKLLSGGNQQKVVLGRWLAGGQARLFIFDEPTVGIDVRSKSEIYKLIAKLAAEGAAVVVSSSDVSEVVRLAHRVAVMAKGRIVKELSFDEVDQNRILFYALGGDVSVSGPRASREAGQQ